MEKDQTKLIPISQLFGYFHQSYPKVLTQITYQIYIKKAQMRIK
jgi:hypothetical protein